MSSISLPAGPRLEGGTVSAIHLPSVSSGVRSESRESASVARLYRRAKEGLRRVDRIGRLPRRLRLVRRPAVFDQSVAPFRSDSSPGGSGVLKAAACAGGVGWAVVRAAPVLVQRPAPSGCSSRQARLPRSVTAPEGRRGRAPSSPARSRDTASDGRRRPSGSGRGPYGRLARARATRGAARPVRPRTARAPAPVPAPAWSSSGPADGSTRRPPCPAAAGAARAGG